MGQGGIGGGEYGSRGGGSQCSYPCTNCAVLTYHRWVWVGGKGTGGGVGWVKGEEEGRQTAPCIRESTADASIVHNLTSPRGIIA